MKCSAGVWIGYLPKEMEGRKILGVEFVSPEDINMEIWKPSFPFAYYMPDNLLFKGENMESISGFSIFFAINNLLISASYSCHSGGFLRYI